MLKLGKIDRKKMATVLEFEVVDFGFLGFVYIFIESRGGNGSKLSTPPEVSYDTLR